LFTSAFYIARYLIASDIFSGGRRLADAAGGSRDKAMMTMPSSHFKRGAAATGACHARQWLATVAIAAP